MIFLYETGQEVWWGHCGGILFVQMHSLLPGMLRENPEIHQQERLHRSGHLRVQLLPWGLQGFHTFNSKRP